MARILVAGIGNIFLGDDAFGCEAVRRLASRTLPENVRVADYGIRGFDLAYALMEDYDAFVLVDAVPRGEAPGTLYKIEVDVTAMEASDDAMVDAHGMNPVQVLSMVRAMGGNPRRVFVIGCEPSPTQSGEDEERMGLSEPVEAALDEAVRMIETLVNQLAAEKGDEYECVESAGNYGAGGGSGGRRHGCA